MPKHSTGKLTKEQHAEQDKRYTEGHEYDYLFIGTGNAAITAAALLVHAGYKVCMLEAHDIPGGYAHSFRMGKFHFCAQVHYIWGCGEGETIYEFLKKIGLEKDITFELYDPEGYDQMVMPDGKRVKIPYGFDKLIDNVEEAYPGQRKPMERLVGIMKKVREEMAQMPKRKLHWWDYLLLAPKFTTLIKYRNKTLQQVFDECQLSQEAQAALSAQMADFMSHPDELSFLVYTGLIGGYNTGAYYPTKHYKYYIDRLVQFITDHEGCHIYYETEVSKINTEGHRVASIETINGKTFTATNIICNADPQMAARELIGWDKFPTSFREKLSYEYAPSGMMLYVGLKEGIDLTKHGLGKNNIWHLQQWDMNRSYHESLEGNFDKTWFFISTPTLHSDEPGTAPEGYQIIEIGTMTDYDSFRELKEEDPKAYLAKKQDLANQLLDLAEKYYIPDLRKYIATMVIGSATTNEDFVWAPQGNPYGAKLDTRKVSSKRLTSETPWNNFFWCNASSGWPGMHGTVSTGVNLYMDLTGDRYEDEVNVPPEEERIEAAWKRFKQQSVR